MPTWLIILLILVLFAGGVLAGLKLSTISEPTGLWARMFPEAVEPTMTAVPTSTPKLSESAKPEKPAESIKPEKPAESALPSPAPSAAVAEEALPAQDPDYVYEILFPQCRDEEEEEEEDFMSVCIFGEDIYWIVFSDDGGELVFRAECSVKEFEDFIKPFILPEASPSPEVSPAAQEPPRPVQ